MSTSLGAHIYVLRHEYELDGYDQMKIIGVYTSRVLAEEAERRFAAEVGFRDYPAGFIIHECQLNEDLWSEGFVTFKFSLESAHPEVTG